MKSLSWMLAWLLASNAVAAADLQITVNGPDGKAVEDAVVALAPRFEMQSMPAGLPPTEMKQQGTLFVPFVLPVTVGTEVSFPNMDEFRHQVYSFSQPKPFELRLYGQDESKTVLFDKPGVVALGCNIHDNMLAFIFVSDHPVMTTTDGDGMAAMSGLEAGEYDVVLWHPDIKGGAVVPAPMVSVSDGAPNQMTATIDLRSLRQKQQAPSEDDY